MNTNLTSQQSFTYKDLLLRKLYYSVVCSVLSQLVLLQIYVFASNLNILHPVQWILSTFQVFTSISTWLFIIPFMTIIFAQSIICAKDYVFKPSYCSTRFQKLISVFSVHNLVLLILNVIVGATLVWLFLSLGGGQYQSLTYQCKGQNYCLQEGTFFLILSGFWMGLYYFVKVYISEKHLSFPVVYQRKVLQMKAQLLPLLKESFMLSLAPTAYFIVLYYVWGFTLREGFISSFGLLQEENSNGILIYFYLWTFGAIYYFNMNLMRFFFNLFLTEPIQFPLFKETNESLCLQESINMSSLPIVQNLACLDLHNLAQWSKCRRRAFFTLSQPGGHPHNWNSLVENVLKLFNEYTELLNKSTLSVEKAKPSVPPIAPPCTFQSPDKFRNLRNMTMVSDNGLEDFVNVTQEPLPVFTLPETVVMKLKQKISNLIAILKAVLGINFFFGELPQANIQKCLANGYLIIWTSQGIADIACSSLVEDPFGIVQKDLPGIVTTLVQLKQSLERLSKVPTLARKIAGYDDFNYRMKAAVTMAVKRSLFSICLSFGNYLNEFPLSKDVLSHLNTIYKS
ncbi:nucleoporin NDC1 [Anoplophora glabripennis]|uniref:nucleoporin NDC1 n=1 Tax=Anoplophora glabripennis TaxID=217634 RepID=UPI000875A8EC|nr:nucleoporin NDC1 [Anoplophora glabripennis]